MDIFSQEWRPLLLKVISLGTNHSTFFWKLVGVVSSELNCGLLDLERTTITKCASQPIHLADEKTGSHRC